MNLLRRRKKGSVYFVAEADLAFVKIGVAVHTTTRLIDLQIGNPRRLEVLASFGGGYQDERGLHDHFASAHVSGEWFRLTDELACLIWLLNPKVWCEHLVDEQLLPVARRTFDRYIVRRIQPAADRAAEAVLSM